MSNSSITPITGATAIGSAVQQVQNNQQLGEQAFLQLLSTQLSNQDPTQPQDESQMLAQLAQFSTVEGVNNQLTSMQQQQATNLLGKTVSALINTNNTPSTVSGQVTSISWNGSTTSMTLNDANHSVVTMPQITLVHN